MLGVVVIIKVMVGAIKKIFEAVIILVLKASTQAKKVFFFFWKYTVEAGSQYVCLCVTLFVICFYYAQTTLHRKASPLKQVSTGVFVCP